MSRLISLVLADASCEARYGTRNYSETRYYCFSITRLALQATAPKNRSDYRHLKANCIYILISIYFEPLGPVKSDM